MRYSLLIFSVFAFLILTSCVSFQDRTLSQEDRKSVSIIGNVDVTFTSYQFFHIIPQNSISKKAYTKLLEKAVQLYPQYNNIDVVNISANGTFNGLSLLIPLGLGSYLVSNWQTIHASGVVIATDGNVPINNRIEMPVIANQNSGIEQAMNNAARLIMNSLNRNSKLAIVNVSSNDRDFSEYVANELEYILVNNRFTVVDRSELNRIRIEQNFQLSGEVDDSTIVSIGKFAGADMVITGSITGTGETRRLRLRVLNTETAQVMAVASERF